MQSGKNIYFFEKDLRAKGIPAQFLYEKDNHLGNVLTTVSDRKIPHTSDNITIDYYTSDITSAQDYYAFGQLMPGRNWSSDSYKFGFNGKLNDDEVFGATGSFQDYGMRMYDTRACRFISPDPIIIKDRKYPELSPFQFAGNRPICAIDLDGLEPVDIVQKTPLVQKTISIVLSEKNISKIVSGYYRAGTSAPFYPGQFHGGIDVGIVIGTPVKSVGKGEVFYSGPISGYGNVVIIKHDNGVFSLYAHLNKGIVKEGSIEQGQVIGESGNSGPAGTPPHLHFEFLINSEAKGLVDLLPANNPVKKKEQKINLVEEEQYIEWSGTKNIKGTISDMTEEQKENIESVINNESNTTKPDDTKKEE
ncbi:MAG TPA: peptidoglycan DD-metalloendopeptidase family protein [Bacteroidales bacterium]|nr:peptidoglycan DD-metalloendopeptidase family protein [Bacteroidales bacterium]HPS16578.1 peptidoglycan DD-metalloendopeptidase family protein [Bacteroidales bacterium]